MGVTNVRDPRDLLPRILDPRENIAAVDETAYIVRETGIDGLRVWFNIPREKFVIEDTKAPGGPAAAYVMVVPDDIDNRTVEALRKLYGGHKQTADELIRGELERERAQTARRQETAYRVAEAVRWAGTDVVPSVAWRDRSAAREDIRKAGRDN